MSYSTFSTELTPDARLRHVVLLSGASLGILGLVVIAALPLGKALKLLAAVAWFAFSAWEILHIAKGYKRCQRIRIAADGSAAVQTCQGDWVDAALQSGSVVLGKLAWLRIVTNDGRQYAELLAGDRRKHKQWRHLHMIWRHLGTKG